MKTERILMVLMLLVSAMLACDSGPSRPNVGGDGTYQILGVALADYDDDYSQVAVSVYRDSAALRSAFVRLGNDTLDLGKPTFADDSLFYLLRDHATSLAGSNLNLTVADSTLASDNFLVTVPDTFSILTVEPPNRIVTGLQSVSVTWSGSDNAEGYVLSAVRRPFHHTGTGYSEYVTSLSTAGTLPPDAFSLSVGNDPDTGWYYIYVYAYIGSLDSSYSNLMLPVPMPDTVSDNIDADPFSGRVASAVIAHRDSVHVVIQP